MKNTSLLAPSIFAVFWFVAAGLSVAHAQGPAIQQLSGQTIDSSKVDRLVTTLMKNGRVDGLCISY